MLDNSSAPTTLEERIASIEATLSQLAERNKRVEQDKAWETSWARKVALVLLTYLITAIVFLFIGVSEALRNALVPTTGFFLSTLTLPFLKRLWISRQ